MGKGNAPALFQEASGKKEKYESVITNDVTIVHLFPFDLIWQWEAQAALSGKDWMLRWSALLQITPPRYWNTWAVSVHFKEAFGTQGPFF